MAIATCVVPLLAAGLFACTSNTEPPVAPSPTPPPSTAGTPAPTVPTMPQAIDGTAFYYQVNSDRTIQVWSLTHGVATRHYRIPVAADDECVENSVVVSPDGQWLAWVTGTGAPGGVVGTLTVATLDGRNPRTVDGVYCSFDESAWSADSRTLTVNGGTTSFDVRSGAVQALTTPDDAVWSANRAFSARILDHSSFVVQTADGRAVHTVSNYSNNYGGFTTCGYSLKGLSDDGRYVSIGGCHTDPGRILGSFDLFDAEANRHVALPVSTPDTIIFVGAGVLVHDAGSGPRLTLMRPDGTVITKLAEPKDLLSARFLTYTPTTS